MIGPMATAGTVAIVLSAGGLPGMAFHAGVVDALAEAGLDAREASLLVGTSAGANITAALRAGLAPGDIWARATDQPLTPPGAEIARRLDAVPMSWEPEDRGGLPRPASLRMAATGVGWPPRVNAAFAGLAPRGRRSVEGIARRFDAAFDGATAWPAEPTWITAVRVRDGALVVFGRDGAEATLGQAVAASSAVPGFFAPMTIGGAEYVDGGLRSTTHADLLAGLEFDLVIVSSAMSAPASHRTTSVRGLARQLQRAVLAAEISALRASGTRVITFQVIREIAQAWPTNPFDSRTSPAVARASRSAAARKLRDCRL